jgi:hypothetical protein
MIWPVGEAVVDALLVQLWGRQHIRVLESVRIEGTGLENEPRDGSRWSE